MSIIAQFLSPKQIAKLKTKLAAIQKETSAVSFRYSKWCAILRAEFPAGAKGDRCFEQVLMDDFKFGVDDVRFARSHSIAGRLLTSEASHRNQCGEKVRSTALYQLGDMPADKQEVVIREAIAANVTIAKVLREQADKAARPAQIRSQPMNRDAQMLAQFMEACYRQGKLLKLPPDVASVAKVYAPNLQRLSERV